MKLIDALIKIDAWTIVFLMAFAFILEPFLIGRSRPKRTENYNALDWVQTMGSMLVLLPLCGRVLGWW